jgi:hypothetical protein
MILRLLPGGEEQQIWTAPLTRNWTIPTEQIEAAQRALTAGASITFGDHARALAPPLGRHHDHWPRYLAPAAGLPISGRDVAALHHPADPPQAGSGV